MRVRSVTKELRTTISLASGEVTHHTPCSREGESTKQLKIKLDEPFIMMYEKIANLQK